MTLLSSVPDAQRKLHDKRIPRCDPRRVREIQRLLFDQVLDEGAAAQASIDVFAELGIERDRSFQQDGRDRLVLEAAGAQERFNDGRQIVPVLIQTSANTVASPSEEKNLSALFTQGLARRTRLKEGAHAHD